MGIWMNSWKHIYVSPIDDILAGIHMKKIAQILFTRENLLALLLCLILIALVIFTADTSPTWIYQGF
jgi:hypothetical protein